MRRSLAPIISSIILIALTLVAGAFAYLYVTGTLHTASLVGVADLQSASLTPYANGGGLLALTFAGGGTVPITSVTMNSSALGIKDGTPIFTNVNIGLGNSQSNQTQIPLNVYLLAGQSYPVVFKVTYADGGTSVISTSIPAGPLYWFNGTENYNMPVSAPSSSIANVSAPNSTEYSVMLYNNGVSDIVNVTALFFSPSPVSSAVSIVSFSPPIVAPGQIGNLTVVITGQGARSNGGALHLKVLFADGRVKNIAIPLHDLAED